MSRNRDAIYLIEDNFNYQNKVRIEYLNNVQTVSTSCTRSLVSKTGYGALQTNQCNSVNNTWKFSYKSSFRNNKLGLKPDGGIMHSTSYGLK